MIETLASLAGGSKHLRVLKEAGLVDVQPRAQRRLHERRAQPIGQLHDWLARSRQLWDARFEELDELIEEPQRKEEGQWSQERTVTPPR
jgi:DNA-binding transcriptional ArsR family regulator